MKQEICHTVQAQGCGEYTLGSDFNNSRSKKTRGLGFSLSWMKCYTKVSPAQNIPVALTVCLGSYSERTTL